MLFRSEEVEGSVVFNPRSKTRFLNHSLKAVNGMETAAESAEASSEENVEKCGSSVDKETSSDSLALHHLTQSEEKIFNLLTSAEDMNTSDLKAAKEEEDRKQEQWDSLAKFLLSKKLGDMKTSDFPHTIDTTQESLKLPIFEDSPVLKEIIVEKRFASRKLPHP